MKFHIRSPRQFAFTLIELSIALVIIGLIVGGVLVGKDLIKVAQSRALIKQMEEIQVAATTFKLKYNCSIGDCPRASTFALGSNGNGDGAIGGLGYPGDCLTAGPSCLTLTAGTGGENIYVNRAFGEQQYVWVHLANSGLIKGNYTTLDSWDSAVPANQMSGYYPKDAAGKAYLIAFGWNRKLYVRTGTTELTEYKHAMFSTSTLDASQMNYISTKYGHPIVLTSNDGYFDALAQNHRVLALGGDNLWLVLGNTATLGTACIVSDGSGGFKYNIEGNGNCNFMYHIDY